jgi:hypothetical protein
MEEYKFIEGKHAKGYLEFACPIRSKWKWGPNELQCCRLEVRQVRAEFVTQEAFYKNQWGKEKWNEWSEMEDFRRVTLGRFNDRKQAIEQVNCLYQPCRGELS